MLKNYQFFIKNLPYYSEEENSASRVRKEKLITDFGSELSSDDNHLAASVVAFVENLLSCLSLLDPEELENGYWKFVSHSAQLCALSILNTLADPQQKLLPSEFWHTNVGDTEKQQQKKVLQNLEDRRYANHLNGSSAVPPIRFVYVAWAIIKIDDKFLFHQREAVEHATEYGLVGGRAKLSDLKKVVGETVAKEELLATIQSPSADLMFQALEFTLSRELLEEANISLDKDHYEITSWRDLKPYQKCMGPAPIYALTQYFIRLYTIKLSTPGYFAMCNQMKQSNCLIACSLAEIEKGKTADNANTLRIEALYDDFNDRRELRQTLEKMEPSYCNCYKFNNESDAIIFSLKNDLLQGNSGKEKPLLLSNLTQKQRGLLLALAIHAKGFPLELNNSQEVRLHKFGWFEIRNAELQNDLRELSETLRQSECPLIEVENTNYYRISMPPNLLFFDPEYYNFHLKPTKNGKGLLIVKRERLSTPLGCSESEQIDIRVASTLFPQLQSVLSADRLHTMEDENLPNKVRKSMAEKYMPFGLRLLLMSNDSYYSFSCRKAI